MYLVFGGRKILLKAARKSVLYSKGVKNQTTGMSSPVERILISAGAPEKTFKNNVEILTSGEVTFARLMQMIAQAKQSISITTYVLGNDAVSAQILEALATQARAGVKVKLLIDSLGSMWAPCRRLRNLKGSGAEVAFFMPLIHLPFRGRGNLRNHRKMILIDGVIGLLGGTNLASEYMGPTPDPNRWIDLSIELKGPSISQLEEVFCADWEFTTGRKISLPKEDLSLETSVYPVQIAPSGPDVPSDSLYDAILYSIFQARRRIWIVTPYFVTDDSLTRGLELAVKRGVEVKILVPRRSNHRVADWTGAGYLRQLNAAGAQICFAPKMIHAKAFLVDDELGLLGSANFDLRSLFWNYEIGLFLTSPDLIRVLDTWFCEICAPATCGIPHASWIRKLVEGIGRMLSPIL